MPGPAHKPYALAQKVSREVGFDPDIDTATACAIMGIKPEDLIAELQFRHDRKRAKMEADMAAAAKLGGETRVLRCPEGDGGYVDLQIHPASYHYWGQRLGYACWQDAQFLREYKRDNPASRVRVQTKTAIVRPELPARAAHSSPNSPRRGPTGRRGRWALAAA